MINLMQRRNTLIGANPVANFVLLMLLIMGLSPHAHAQVTDNEIYASVIADQLEFRANQGANTYSWDVQAWLGTDYNKLWVKTEGERRISRDGGGEAEVQALYSRLISPFWDLQIGLRHDKTYGSGSRPSRTFAVLGAQGLAPYWFELEPALFVSNDGGVSARLTGTYDLLVTQRLIAQPRLETNIAGETVKRFGVGSGINDVRLGIRLRYEFKREFAPYIGVSWQRKFGNTARLARDEGSNVENLSFVTGVRLVF